MSCLAQQGIYSIEKGKVFFKSDAPLELIESNSEELRGLIDFEKSDFAFSIPVSSFQGFNSALQKEHFNENYLETDKYPRATFKGKIIEDIDPDKEGKYTIRAKGILSIHGVEQERIIRADVQVKGGEIQITSDFTVLLREHDITIPKIVYQKIAEEIFVRITATAKK
ncbi:MAG: YceI family protein [Candidatus Cyclobacteriaceae bacterium M2_1C_046]